MSEISDAVQIIRVGYDTIEIAMKVGSGSIEMMQKAVNLLIGLLEHEKTMGKTNLKGLLEKGGDIQVLTFADEDLKKFQIERMGSQRCFFTVKRHRDFV